MAGSTCQAGEVVAGDHGTRRCPRYRPRGRRLRAPGRSPGPRASRGGDGRMGGGRSSPEWSSGRQPKHGSGRDVAAGHDRGCGGPLRPPGVTRSTVTCAGAAGSGSGHGGTMDGGEVLAGSTGSRLRCTSKGTERGKRTVSSRGSRRGGRRARGRPSGDEFDGAIRGTDDEDDIEGTSAGCPGLHESS